MTKIISAIFLSLLMLQSIFAAEKITTRIPQFSNSAVTVWKTTVYPSKKKMLKMHRHDHDRIVVALTDGLLKVTNNKSQVHYLKLKKNTAYFLLKDVPNETHVDENMTGHPIEVMVIELNKR